MEEPGLLLRAEERKYSSTYLKGQNSVQPAVRSFVANAASNPTRNSEDLRVQLTTVVRFAEGQEFQGDAAPKLKVEAGGVFGRCL